MSLLIYFMFLAIVALTDGSNILPRAPHPDIRSPAFVELHNVILKARSDIKPRGIHDRLHIPAHNVRKRMQSQESAAAAVKRTLLGARQSCDAGYGYCYGPSLHPGTLSINANLNCFSIWKVLSEQRRHREMLRRWNMCDLVSNLLFIRRCL